MTKIKNFSDILAFIEANKDFSAYDFVVAHEVKSRAKSEISPVQFEKVCSEASLIVSDSFSEPDIVINIRELVQEILEKYDLSECDDEEISEDISVGELAYKISTEANLSKHEYDMFVSDFIYNFRGIEWFDIVMEKCSPSICKSFRKFIKYSDEDMIENLVNRISKEANLSKEEENILFCDLNNGNIFNDCEWLHVISERCSEKNFKIFKNAIMTLK